LEVLMRREAVDTAVSRFVELPTVQRSVVILKDVLDLSLEEIAAMLGFTVNAVKGHLGRGRARLKAINAQAPAQPAPLPPSPAVARYVALFNARDWDGLRAMLADDVQLIQSSHPLRAGAADVGMFFGVYSRSAPDQLHPRLPLCPLRRRRRGRRLQKRYLRFRGRVGLGQRRTVRHA
jgi:Sigma-70, region 4